MAQPKQNFATGSSVWWRTGPAGGVDFIQLREKDLDPRQLQSLAGEMMERIDRNCSKLLVNVSAAGSAGAGPSLRR